MRYLGALAKLLLAESLLLLGLFLGPVPLASLTIAGPVAQPSALPGRAVAVPPILPEADVEPPAAVRAGDLDEIDRTLLLSRHLAGEADLDIGRREWEALSVTR